MRKLYAVWQLDPRDMKSWLRVGYGVLPWPDARRVAAEFWHLTLRRTVVIEDGINPNLLTPAWLKRVMAKAVSANTVGHASTRPGE